MRLVIFFHYIVKIEIDRREVEGNKCQSRSHPEFKAGD